MRRRSGYGWLELIIGIVLLVMGMFTLFNPGFALTGLVVVFGILAIVMGVADILLYVRMERYIGFGPILSLVSGILSVMSGIMLLVYPNAGRWILSLLFPIWFISQCISRLCNLQVIRITAGTVVSYLTMIINIIGVILGFMMLFDPIVAMVSVSYLVSFYLIILGIDELVIAFSEIGS